MERTYLEAHTDPRAATDEEPVDGDDRDADGEGDRHPLPQLSEGDILQRYEG